jgi:hypothetical protein
MQELFIHHWVIAAPTGPTSTGVCKHCGASREFVNKEPLFFYPPQAQAQKK